MMNEYMGDTAKRGSVQLPYPVRHMPAMSPSMGELNRYSGDNGAQYTPPS